MQLLNKLKKKTLIIASLVLIASILLAAFAYWVATVPKTQAVTSKPTIEPTVPAKEIPTLKPTLPLSPTPTPTPKPVPTISPTANPATILGLNTDPQTTYPGISWVRLSYPTCGWGNLTGNVLRNTIQSYHNHGIHVLLITCQPLPAHLFDTSTLNDVAHGGADAVQCGNEEMKYDPPLTNYVQPADFAKYFDLCQHAVHAVNPGVPVILGALDPHVGGIDYQPLLDQVGYLNQMQNAMNTTVHPGGNWSWRSQILGLIDSWHNGYPSQYTNSLYYLFVFWAQQFGVDLNSGALGRHLWVVEGTGCFKGCGIDPSSSYQVGVSHILTLITDVQTTMRYRIPFFYFTNRDFVLSGVIWPIGILDINGHSKPLRQDLPMGARTLEMSCSNGQVNVDDQEKLLAKLYNGCSLPGNYIGILTS